MRRLTLTLTLLTAVFLARPAHAAGDSRDVQRVVRMTRASIVAPPEWDGVWTTQDSVYSCAGAFQSTSTSSDTICGGKDYTPAAPGSPLNFVCTGSADATTIDLTCTGSGEIFTDCTANFVMVMHGTRSGDTYHMVSTVDVTYTGTACSFFPPTCTQIDSWGTRDGPAPTDYCSTPARKSTWGQLKTRYR
jgi:hypothetical protein